MLPAAAAGQGGEGPCRVELSPVGEGRSGMVLPKPPVRER